MLQQIIFKNEHCNWNTLNLINFLKEGNIPSNWNQFFIDNNKILNDISNKLKKEINLGYVIYPEIKNVFKTFKLSPNNIKLVILGQDPYHNGNATGLCFSISKNCKKINPSLMNIYKELENEGFNPMKTGDLSYLLKQGCFLYNTALTVRKDKPETHIDYWCNFTENLLQYISDNTKNIAWLFLGKHAHNYNRFSEKNGHISFTTSHPSPFSANKKLGIYPAFLGSNVFIKINDFLEKNKKEKIYW